MIWQAVFDIKPQPKQSCRFSRGRAYTPKKKAQYVDALHAMALAQRPPRLLQGPLRMRVWYVWPWPKRLGKYKGLVRWRDTNPDVTDNLNKPLADALAGVVYRDDGAICDFHAQKLYGQAAMIEVEVEELELLEANNER